MMSYKWKWSSHKEEYISVMKLDHHPSEWIEDIGNIDWEGEEKIIVLDIILFGEMTKDMFYRIDNIKKLIKRALK